VFGNQLHRFSQKSLSWLDPRPRRDARGMRQWNYVCFLPSETDADLPANNFAKRRTDNKLFYCKLAYWNYQFRPKNLNLRFQPVSAIRHLYL